MADSTLSLLRLLHITDSSFPVGGYAYSHGLEWLVATGRVSDEAGVDVVTRSLVEQTLRRQWLPAAARAYRAQEFRALLAVDDALDASIAAESEREAGRAVGARLLEVLATRGADSLIEKLHADVLSKTTPGQFAVAFSAAGRDCGAAEREVLAALAYSLVNSIPQAAIRLGVIGPSAGARIVASAAPAIANAVQAVNSDPRPRIGAFSPMLEIAAMLQPTLQFRMFAS